MTFNRRFYGAAGLAVCASLLLPSLCPAHGFYLGTGVGSGFEGLDCAAGAHCDKNAAAVYLRTGYQFTPRWGVEVGVIGIGQTSGTLDRGLGTEAGQARLGGALYQGTATWQRGPWSLTAKLGLADNIARSSFMDYPTRDHTGITASAGAEVSYRIETRWSVGLADQYRPSVELTDHTRASVNALLAGFSYEFGR